MRVAVSLGVDDLQPPTRKSLDKFRIRQHHPVMSPAATLPPRAEAFIGYAYLL